MSKFAIGHRVTITTGQHRGEAGEIVGKPGAMWAVRLPSGKTLYLPSGSLRRADA